MTHVWVVRYYTVSSVNSFVDYEIHRTMTKEKFAKLAAVDDAYVDEDGVGLYVDCTLLPNHEEHLGYDIVEVVKEELRD